MLKAIFLDMDETLCDTTGANKKATTIMAAKVAELFPGIDNSVGQSGDENSGSLLVAEHYLKGIYRELDQRYQDLLFPVENEEAFRIALIQLILADQGFEDCSQKNAQILQNTFDQARTAAFDFFPGIQDWLAGLRSQFKLVVITNGPEFSQVVKVQRVELDKHVDHVIIGGQEPEQKPAASIFEKALRLVACEKHQVIHVGDSLAADIKGANNAGIDSIWISHGEDLDDIHEAEPTHIIEHPSQLRELIETLHLQD